MNSEELSNYIKSAILERIKVSTLDDKFLIQLPFNSYKGESIEIEVTPRDDGSILIDDVGLIAGLLFELNEHTEEAPGHLLTKRLTNSYEFTMDYDEGVISRQISVTEDTESLLNFIKAITSIETVLPFIRKPHKRTEGRKRLSATLGKDISQLRLPLKVQKQTRVEGKHETWDIDYEYIREADNIDILILAADLGLKEPKERVAYTLTLASDVLDKDVRIPFHRELRIVYSLNGNGTESARRAASMIDDYQERIGYRAFNYADLKDKSYFTDLTIQDLTPMRL